MDLYVVWGPWVFYMCNANQVSWLKGRKGGAFLQSFQESLFLVWNGDQLCSECMKKRVFYMCDASQVSDEKAENRGLFCQVLGNHYF